MKETLTRLAADYSVFLPLLLLCAYFSWATYGEQFPVGAAAARQVADEIRASHPKANVLIAGSQSESDHEFVVALEEQLAAADCKIVGTARGTPAEALKAIKAAAAEKQRIDVIACSDFAGRWPVFDNVKTIDPILGEPVRILPRTYFWPSFLTASNLTNLADQIAIYAILAIGMTMVIVTGGIDLSVGSLVAFSAVLAAVILRDVFDGKAAGALGTVVACTIAVAACGLIGAGTGTMVAFLKLPPFIVTLAVMLIARGAAGILCKSESIDEVPALIDGLGRGRHLGAIPNPVVLMLALYAAAHVVMSRMRLGRHVYAVGGNVEAARLSGVPVRRVLVIVYAASGVFAGLCGVIELSTHRSASFTYGQPYYELYAITAVVVGGTGLSGGQGSIFGTLLGAFTIAVVHKGLNMTGVSSHVQLIVLGAIILAAVMFDEFRRRQ